MAVRLFVLLARRAPCAVVLRRGPSKCVLMCLWRTDVDQVTEGQWLKGRVYERRCDLSPSGKRLIYFAANYKRPYFSWTAVSRPPFFGALALWPKGDAWGGGGLFSSEHEILLNHRNEEMRLAQGFKVSPKVRVRPFGARPGWGEDSPLWDYRMQRDGWLLRHPGTAAPKALGARTWIAFAPPIQWSRPEPGVRPRHELWMIIDGIKERSGPWYATRYEVREKGADQTTNLGRCDWADWSPGGDLLFAKSGKLLRLVRREDGGLSPVAFAKCVVDLTDRVFVPRKAPAAAKTWFTDLPSNSQS